MVFVKTKRNRNKFRYNFRVFLFWYPVSHSSTRVYGVRCTVFVSANELAAQTSRVSGERANECPVRSFQHYHKWKSAYSFLSLGSYLNMYHGYASLKKEHFLPVFTEKRALFQHILRDAKSTKCEIKEHLGERGYLVPADTGHGIDFTCSLVHDAP